MAHPPRTVLLVDDLIATGGNHICALESQQAQCVGLNFWGEVGVGSQSPQNSVVSVMAPPATFSTLSAGTSHTCGITPGGDAFCWGRNFEGEIGVGSMSFTANKPTQVITP